MVFEIRQLNSDNYNDKVLHDVIELCCYSFGATIDTISLFLEREISNFKNTRYPLQHFYMIDTSNNKIVAALGVIIRECCIPDKKNLVITFVNTAKDYRKQGLMDILINKTMSIYENTTYGINLEKFIISLNTLNDAKAFSNKYVNDGSYWTLYSAVGDYYSRFGFSSCKTLNYYKTKTKLLDDIKFEIGPNEEFLTSAKASYYLTDDKFVPHIENASMKNIRCSSFKYPSAFRFMNGAQLHFNALNITVPHFGLVIHSDFGDTIFCLVHYFDLKRIYIRRLFSSVTDDSILNEHLERVYNYLLWFVNKFTVDKSETEVFCSEGDIVYDGNSSRLLNLFKNKGWEWDASNTKLNPMIREWKAQQPAGEWIYNGMWCVT